MKERITLRMSRELIKEIDKERAGSTRSRSEIIREILKNRLINQD